MCQQQAAALNYVELHNSCEYTSALADNERLGHSKDRAVSGPAGYKRINVSIEKNTALQKNANVIKCVPTREHMVAPQPEV